MNLGNQKWQAELLFNFAIALISGVLLVFAVLVLLYRRFLAPFVNMGSLLLAPLGAAIALHIAGQPVSLFVLIGILMLFGIVAKNSILLVDFAVEMMNHGMAEERGDLGGRAQARAADRDDHGGDGRGHAADRDFDQRRQQLARADGHHRDRRPDLLDAADAAPGPGLFLDRHLDRSAGSASCSTGSSARKRTATASAVPAE